MIPSQIFTIYETAADEMISVFGTDCLIKYPSDPVATATNVPEFKTSKSLRPFDNNPDQTFIHDDEEIKGSESSEVIRMRVYWTPKDFVKVGGVLYPDVKIQTIGYYSDITKLKRCVEIWPDVDKGFCFVPAGDPIPWGLRKSRYCVAFWKLK
jgi:hypothetical protein